MQLPSLPAVVSVPLPAADGVTKEVTVTLECSSVHEMMVIENVLVNLTETVLPLESFVKMPALERHAEMPVLVFDHPTLGQCRAYPIGCSHEWLLLVSSPHRLQEYQARRLPTLAHLLHANSCISCRNLLPVVHVAWLGWHGGTVRNSEH